MNRLGKIFMGILLVLGWILFVALTTMVTKFVWVRTNAGFGTLFENTKHILELEKRMTIEENRNWFYKNKKERYGK